MNSNEIMALLDEHVKFRGMPRNTEPSDTRQMICDAVSGLEAENTRLRGALRIEFDLQMWGRQMTFAEALQISDVIGDFTPEMAELWGEYLTPDVLSGYTPHVPTEEEQDGLTELRTWVHGLIMIVEAFLDLEAQGRTEVTEHALGLARADMQLGVQQLKGVIN